jgi:hypothetical protein
MQGGGCGTGGSPMQGEPPVSCVSTPFLAIRCAPCRIRVDNNCTSRTELHISHGVNGVNGFDLYR